MHTLTRRYFLTAGATLAAALPVLPAAAARAAAGKSTMADIRDFVDNGDWIRAFNEAFRQADSVTVPAEVICDNINTAITLPPGKTLHVAGSLKGNGRGRFILQKGCQIIGSGAASLYNIPPYVRGGGLTIAGPTIGDRERVVEGKRVDIGGRRVI